MVYRFILLFFLFFYFTGVCYANLNSKNYQFSVITIGPNQSELYSAFGHSGIRYKDDSLGLDYFYNYGIFDFDQPNFYINFLNGRLLYMVGRFDFNQAKKYYLSENRYIKEQVLNINDSQKIKLLAYLENNLKDENKFYLYNYVYNNCATKIRDAIDEVLDNKIIYKESTSELSIRNLMDIYLDHQKWGDLGIDICLGSEIDKNSNYFSSMFLPDFLFNSLEEATLPDGSNVVYKTYISEPINTSNTNYFITPFIVFFLLFIVSLFISIKELKYGLRYNKFDFLLFFLSGIIGCLITYLWFFTDHLSANNFNIIWAIPLNLIISFFLFNTKFNSIVNYYLIYYLSSLLILCFFWIFLPQELNDSLIFLILTLLIRSCAIINNNLKLRQ
jgi:hypothetical protein|tara:strand:- start:5870 stop:7033 length:1164 start_codon:yes stop_codon:yes gene_type:complete